MRTATDLFVKQEAQRKILEAEKQAFKGKTYFFLFLLSRDLTQKI